MSHEAGLSRGTACKAFGRLRPGSPHVGLQLKIFLAREINEVRQLDERVRMAGMPVRLRA